MKTQILYKVRNDSVIPNRASFPGDGECRDVAKFWPAHTETGLRILDLTSGKTRPFTRQRHDSVEFHSVSFEFKRGQTERAKVIPQEYIDELDKIDGKIESLMRQRNDMLNEAWRRGRLLKVGDVKQVEKVPTK